jgi:penicillin-binding protein 2
MAGVVTPPSPEIPMGGTAYSAHLQGIDFAGKTGSAQVVSNAFRKNRGGDAKQFNDNSWFVGVTPRRNPEIVVAVLFEGGEHGKLAARLAAQIVKAYVEKQRRIRNNPALFSDKADPGAVPIGGVWGTTAPAGGQSDPGQPGIAESSDAHLHGGTLLVKMTPRHPAAFKKAAARPAVGTAGGN